jgi:diacylglycerol kinase (ATP)
VNPTAGQGFGLRAGALVAARLRAGGVEVEELTGTDAADLSATVRRVLGGVPAPDALVVVGGDGMVHLGVGQVAGTPIPLGIVAAGTGNDLARALALPIRDAEAGAEAILTALEDLDDPSSPHRRRIDAVRCTPSDRGTAHDHRKKGGGEDGREGAGNDGGAGGGERWFAGVLGAGFDALVNERANGWTWPRGRAKYVAAMLRELPVFRPRQYTIEVDGEPLSTAAMLVTVANGPSYGGGMRVAPDASLDDGLLDVMVVEPLSRARFLAIFPRVYAGTHVQNPRVSIRRARSVVLRAPGIVAYADGERIGPLPLTCQVVPGALVVLAARAAETSAR